VTTSLDTLQLAPTSAISEAQLEQGGLGVMTSRTLVEPCACGGVIYADERADLIADAVRIHNLSADHQRWAIDAGWRHG
jgi:hypothetical protein